MTSQPSSASIYSPEKAGQLLARSQELTGIADRLSIDLMTLAVTAPPKAATQINEGVCRRLRVLHDSAAEVFRLIPPSNTRANRKTIRQATLSLHAFLINAVGIMDNMAWAYVYWHALDNGLQRTNVDLFKSTLQARLPQEWVDFLTSSDLVAWQNSYLKPYRDALAHRIPPYIPESYPPAETVEINRLRSLMSEAAKAQDWDAALALQDEVDQQLGHAFSFLHTQDAPVEPLILHPQMLADLATIEEALRLFLRVVQTSPRTP